MLKRDWEKDWKLCQCATPGPWEVELVTPSPPGKIEHFEREWICECGSVWEDGVQLVYVFPRVEVEVATSLKDDAEFIANSREALPYWLQQARKLEEENRKLREAIKEAYKYAETVEKFVQNLFGVQKPEKFVDFLYGKAKAIEHLGKSLKREAGEWLG